MPAQPLNIYIGLDRDFGKAGFQVCRQSLLHHASCPLNITALDLGWLRRIGLYRRQFYESDGQRYDALDGKPFSTEFSFSRFLTPSLQPSGWAIFCDSDFLFRRDIAELAELFSTEYAVMVVKHQFRPERGTKMLGQIQDPYPRKNWTSLMAWNCDHVDSKLLTPYQVNHQSGSWLHQLKWLRCEQIGSLPEEWNWLDGHSSPKLEPAAVHYTRGTPDMGEPWNKTQYAHEWLAIWSELDGNH